MLNFCASFPLRTTVLYISSAACLAAVGRFKKFVTLTYFVPHHTIERLFEHFSLAFSCQRILIICRHTDLAGTGMQECRHDSWWRTRMPQMAGSASTWWRSPEPLLTKYDVSEELA